MTDCIDGTCSPLVYFITDPLGSVIEVLDANGELVSQSRYLPFGGVRSDVGDVAQTDIGYTGQRDLDAQGNSYSLGLMDYHARFYDHYLNRWTQPDSIIPDGNPQSLNRYSYVNNSPINFNDPTGHMLCDDVLGDQCISDGGGGSGGSGGPPPKTGGQPPATGGNGTSPSISPNNVDNGYLITSIGGVPAIQPNHGKMMYGDIEDSCGGCSAEGYGHAPGVDELGVINDIAAAGLDYKSIYDEDEIIVYVAYLRSIGIQVNSLYIINRTNQPVSVMSVDFNTHQFAPVRFCYSGSCLFSAPDEAYKIIPGPSINASGDHVGVGPVSYPGGEPIGLTTRISLIPSGNPYNPNNSFYWNTEVTINVRLAYTDTGSYWPTISYTFAH